MKGYEKRISTKKTTINSGNMGNKLLDVWETPFVASNGSALEWGIYVDYGPLNPKVNGMQAKATHEFCSKVTSPSILISFSSPKKTQKVRRKVKSEAV